MTEVAHLTGPPMERGGGGRMMLAALLPLLAVIPADEAFPDNRNNGNISGKK